MPPHVFISYSRQDQPYARKLADDLRADGVEVWLDDRVDFGDRWWRTIVKAIHACAAFVVVMTPESEESKWVEREVLLAQREGKTIFPLLLRGAGHALVIEMQHVDVTGGRMPPKAFYDRLRRTLPAPESVAGHPSRRPPARKRPSETSRAKPRVETPAKKRRRKAPAVKPAEPPRADFEPELVYIPAGPFLIGSDDGLKREQPQHTVELSAYWIGKYPVTNAQYQAFVRDGGREPPEHWDGDAYLDEKGDHPVVYVSWDDAVAYCKWLGEKTGKEYRLPTEAQWEKAARGEHGRKYPWGNEFDASRLNNSLGGLRDTSPVGQFSPKGDSPHGVADMAGNVWEWCADWYDKAEYKRRADGAVVDPEGPSEGTVRVLRGGAFDLNEVIVRCSARDWCLPDFRGSLIGFRVVFRPLSVDGRSIDG